MGSNEQTEVRGKIERDSWIKSRMTAMGGSLRGGGIECKGNKTH